MVPRLQQHDKKWPAKEYQDHIVSYSLQTFPTDRDMTTTSLQTRLVKGSLLFLL